MQIKKNLRIPMCCIIVFWLLTFCTTSIAAYPVSIQDSKGNHLVFASQPQAVVSLVPSAAEILFKIGAKKFIKAITYHDCTLKGAEGKLIAGGFFSPSLEKIKSVSPDLIILSPIHKNLIKIFKQTDCKLFVFKTSSIEDSYRNIRALGKIFNRENQAEKVIKENISEINHIKLKLAGIKNLKRKRVMRLMGKKTIMTPGSDSFQNEIIRAAGGISPDFGKKGDIVQVTKKEWMNFNPEFIYGCTPEKKLAKKIFQQPGWKDVAAVKNRRIYFFPCDLTCRASTNTGYFVSWLSSEIYTDEFSNPENDILSTGITRKRPLKVNLEYVRSAAIYYSNIFDFENKTLLIDFKSPMKIVSTLEGSRDNITSIANHFTPPPTWGPGYKTGIDHLRSSILKAVNRQAKSTSLLITGADMDKLSIQTQSYKDMKVYAFVTAGVMGNAQRMSKDTGRFYEPGTINIIIITNMKLSQRAMTRAIITATEGKTAALDDLDIRSSFTPGINEATGTGTDNVLVVQGCGVKIDNTGGHSKMGELIAKAVYTGVKEAVLKQNGIYAERSVFQRLKERKINIYQLVSGAGCACACKNDNFAAMVEHILLEPEYAGFIEASLAISDEYEKGLIKDLTSFKMWCTNIAESIAGTRIEKINDIISNDTLPMPVKTALNAIMTGIKVRQLFNYKKKSKM